MIYQPPVHWLENPFFHHKDKKCSLKIRSKPDGRCPNFTHKTQTQKTSYKTGLVYNRSIHKKCSECRYITRYFCDTHKVLVCKGSEKENICGWQFGTHPKTVWLGAWVPFTSIKNQKLEEFTPQSE